MLIVKTLKMEVFTIKCQQPWFDEIKSGRKTVEGRTGGCFDIYIKCPIGGNIMIINAEDSTKFVMVKLVTVRHYSTLLEYLQGEGWARTAPHTGSLDNALSAYFEVNNENNIPVFSPSRIRDRGGINALEISLI
jgi:ASC-1-like (ASCH) protein